VEFVSDEHETIGGFSHSCRVTNVRFEAGEESQWVLVVPALEGCYGGSRSADNCLRRQTVANFIVNRPIWELCAGAVRRRGSPIRPFWWDQPMDLDLARERGLLLVQGPAGPAIVEDENED
jgi:hypothetical protein